jgi:hypothetical protein
MPELSEIAGKETCLNCGEALVGKFCHDCGQGAHVHRHAGALLHDLAHSVLHFEGKLWRTLPALFWRPGLLTRRYIEGQRARYLSPLAAFLFSVFLMFAAFNLFGRAAYYVEPPAGSAAAAEEVGPVEMDLEGAPGPLGWFDGAYRKAKSNPTLLSYKLQTSAYKFSWALIPIMVPFLWLTFLHRRRYRRRYGLYDHTVFVTYALAFLSLFAIGYTFLKLAGMNGPVALLPFALPIIHLYRQLRGAYGLSRPSALWRTAALVILAFIAGALFFMLLLMLGVLS